MLTTTLNEIRSHSPSKDGWEKLLDHLGKTQADDEVLPILTVLNVNGFMNALWVFNRCTNPLIQRLLAADYAERVLPVFRAQSPNDTRPADTIAIARNPLATEEELKAAQSAAWSANAALRVDAWVDSRVAAMAAARSAARSAAGDMVDVVVEAQSAAWTAARIGPRAARRSEASRDAQNAAVEAQKSRLHQYLAHGEVAKDIPWSK